jgi:predicted transcriptional regulator
MKMKTSISIDRELLEKVGKIAARDERSKAYVIEKLMELLVTVATERDPSQSLSELLLRVSQELKKRR